MSLAWKEHLMAAGDASYKGCYQEGCSTEL
jgi:hypothetical protein